MSQFFLSTKWEAPKSHNPRACKILNVLEGRPCHGFVDFFKMFLVLYKMFKGIELRM